MTREDKIRLLSGLLRQITNHEVLSWGETEYGYQWVCRDHAAALLLSKRLLEMIVLLRLDAGRFPHTFGGDDFATLVISPIDD